MTSLPTSQELIKSVISKINSKCCKHYCYHNNQSFQVERKVNHIENQLQFIKQKLSEKSYKEPQPHQSQQTRQQKQYQLTKKIPNYHYQKNTQKRCQTETNFLVPHRHYETGKTMKSLIYGRKDRYSAPSVHQASGVNYDRVYKQVEQRYQKISASAPKFYNRVQSKIRNIIQKDRLKSSDVKKK